MNIRNATPGDVGAICNIYNYYVEHTAVTFETMPVSESEMKNRMNEVIESGHSFCVGEAGDKIIGYYYTHRWNNRCAYSTTLEESIYLDKDERGKGYGTQLFQHLLAHIDHMKRAARSYHEISLSENTGNGTFVAPVLFELNNLDELKREVFGPVLHVVRYRADGLDNVINQINSKGYALTHGIHSRIDGTIEHICRRIEAGNVYVNRNIVGAVVGVQPFGGHGLSGTGPKAGGPFYLQLPGRLLALLPPFAYEHGS